MGKSENVELPTGETIPILYEDRSALAVDKPAGWMLVPVSWQNTGRNLQAALMSSIRARDFWARSRGLRFLRYAHRLDTDTTGILLFGKSPGAVATLSRLFESRQMEKVYLAVVEPAPSHTHWTCREPLAFDPRRHGRMVVSRREGKPAETEFRLLETRGRCALLEALPYSGRTHQIRLHLAHAGCPVVGDALYGPSASDQPGSLGLRAVRLSYVDPFTRRPVRIEAPSAGFLRDFGFAGVAAEPR